MSENLLLPAPIENLVEQLENKKLNHFQRQTYIDRAQAIIDALQQAMNAAKNNALLAPVTMKKEFGSVDAVRKGR